MKIKNLIFSIFFYHELVTTKLVEENQQLQGDTRNAEQDLEAEQAKRLKTEQKLGTVIRDSEKTKQHYKQTFTALAQKVAII